MNVILKGGEGSFIIDKRLKAEIDRLGIEPARFFHHETRLNPELIQFVEEHALANGIYWSKDTRAFIYVGSVQENYNWMIQNFNNISKAEHIVYLDHYSTPQYSEDSRIRSYQIQYAAEVSED